MSRSLEMMAMFSLAFRRSRLCRQRASVMECGSPLPLLLPADVAIQSGRGLPHSKAPAAQRTWVGWVLLAIFLLLPLTAPAQGIDPANTTPPVPTAADPGGWKLAIDLEGADQPGRVSVALQIVVVMTLLTLAPSLIMLMTCFTRIVIVLGFVRTALGVPSAPSNQIVVGLSLFLTIFVMGPVLQRANEEGLQPYLAGELRSSEALERASQPLKEFMLQQTRTRDLEFFLQLGRFPPTRVQDVPLRVVIPAFIVSELQTAFQMGFLLFLPFLVIDLLISSTLMSLGMMMMPPAIVSLPFKLLLFVLVDGWHLVVKSLVDSFQV